MAQCNIIITGLAEQETALNELRDQLSQCSPWARRAEFTVCVTGELEFAQLEGAQAVVLFSRDLRGHESMRYVVSMLEQAALPVLTLSDRAEDPKDPLAFAGHLIEPESTPPPQLCMALRSLIHRQDEISQLRRELTIASKQHGGLRHQITKIHEELQLAALVQREYLPRELPVVHGIDVGVLWRPASYVSGDIYDVIRLDEDHLGVFIADAVGHGVPAALLTMIICKSLRTKAVDEHGYRVLSPAEVLYALNGEMIARRGRSTRFATAIYAVVNCRQRTMQLARAGHPAPLLLTGQGDTRVIEPSGGLLGVFADEQYEQVDLELHIGDRLLLYSDGFEQAFPDLHEEGTGKPLPNERYLDVFDDLKSEDSAQKLIEAMSERLDGHQGSLHPNDDLTLMCLHAGSLQQMDVDQRVLEQSRRSRPRGSHGVQAQGAA